MRPLPLGLAGLLLAFASAQALPPETSEWYLLESRGVQLLTDGSPDRAEALFDELMSFGVALEESCLPPGPDADGRPLLVYLFAGERSFAAYKPVSGGVVSGAAGLFLPRREGAYLAMDMASPSAPRIVRHELVHFAMFRRFGGAPPWLDEGLAEYLAAGRFEGDAFVLGEPIEGHRRRLRRGAVMPADKLVRVPAFAAAHAGGDAAHRLYAESWALVHWLRTGGEAARALHDSLLAELARRGPAARDLIELGGFEPRALERRVRAHHAAETLPVERVGVPRHEGRVLTRRRVDRPVALAMLGELLLALGRDRAAEEHFEAARSRRDGLARAWRGLGLLRERAGFVDEARPFLERAAELAPRDPEVLLSYGRNLLGVTARDFDADRVQPADAVRARELLRRAVALAPDRAESLAALGLAGLMTEKGADAETGAALETARGVLPHRTDVAYHLMLWHLRRDELDELLALLDDVVLPREAKGSELAVRASNIAAGACLQQAERLHRSGRHDEAVALLEARLAAGVHEAMGPQLKRRLRQLRARP